MDLTPYIQNLRDDLLAAASVGDEEVRRAAVLLTGAVEPAARLAIMAALSDLAAEVTGALQQRTDIGSARQTSVELRLDGRDVRVSVTSHTTSDPAGARSDEPGGRRRAADDQPDGAEEGQPTGEDWRRAVHDASGELSRTTVRLFNELKTQAEQAAADQGVSLNTYISRAVADSVRSAVPGKSGNGRRGRSDRKVTGYVRA